MVTDLPDLTLPFCFLCVYVSDLCRQLKLEKICNNRPSYVCLEQQTFLGFRDEVSML